MKLYALLAFVITLFCTSFQASDVRIVENKLNDISSVSKDLVIDQEELDQDDALIQPEEVAQEPVVVNDAAQFEKPVVKMPLIFEKGDSSLEIYNKLRVDAFFGKNLRLLNDNNPTDKVAIPGRHTLDTSVIYRCGFASHCHDVVKLKGTLRNKYTWGDADGNASTTFNTIKAGDVVFGDHSHGIPLNLPIIRELWMELTLNDIVHHSFKNPDRLHYLTMGLFPFQLGRGIALGDAYTVSPELLGYNPAFAVQQYAPGIKFGGQLMDKKALLYDLYVAILDNKSDTFDNVNMKTRGQQCGHRFNQARGFGIINYLIAGHLKWFPYNEPCKKLSLEPYILFDHERHQKVDFPDDAMSKLGTAGLAMEGQYGNFSFGFDTAANFGSQTVFCWDRNAIVPEIRNGVFMAVNDKVTAINNNPATNDLAGKKAVYTPANQEFIDTTPQNVCQNGQRIDDSNLKNDLTRFRPCYKNFYRGAMAVADFDYKFTPDFKLAAGFGWARGDESPNKDLESPNDSRCNSDYNGFVSLQEIYYGTRVRSAFLLSGPARIPRVLSFPSPDLPDNKYPATVTRFTNLRFGGAALWWDAHTAHHTWNINSNIIAFWQDHRTRIFEEAEEGRLSRPASSFLGVEINAYIETMLMQDLKFFVVSSVFVPGTHYKDIKGRPLNKDQQKFLDSLDVTGINTDRVPVLGADPAFFANFGLEYKF